MAGLKQRLDLLLVARGLSESRERAQQLIMAGEVFVNGQRVNQASAPVGPDAVVDVRGGLPYVSRGGIKLAAALDEFAIGVTAKTCTDVGASTGGFTDVLLQRGAAKVYAIDVGYGQLDWRLRNDARVVVMERTNIRYIESLPEPIDLACVDVSFISLRLVLPVVKRLLADSADVIALIKPQFEAGKGQVGKGGVVRDPNVHRAVLAALADYCAKNGWAARGLRVSPIKGPAGNVEFLIHLKAGAEGESSAVQPQTATSIEAALAAAQAL